MNERSSSVSKVVSNNLRRAEKKLNILQKELKEAENREYLKICGDLITSNIYRISKGDKVLTADDYAFIKTMTAMTDLDLADAVSDGKKVPDNAFKDMSELTNVKMSESDTVWGKYIFTGNSSCNTKKWTKSFCSNI